MLWDKASRTFWWLTGGWCGLSTGYEEHRDICGGLLLVVLSLLLSRVSSTIPKGLRLPTVSLGEVGIQQGLYALFQGLGVLIDSYFRALIPRDDIPTFSVEASYVGCMMLAATAIGLDYQVMVQVDYKTTAPRNMSRLRFLMRSLGVTIFCLWRFTMLEKEYYKQVMNRPYALPLLASVALITFAYAVSCRARTPAVKAVILGDYRSRFYPLECHVEQIGTAQDGTGLGRRR